MGENVATDSRLVYSTETGRIKEALQPQPQARGDGIVRLRRETAGRKGKGVIVIAGLAMDQQGLQQLAKELKKLCGTGGSVKNDVIEIQGDHRGKIKAFLESRDFKVKLAGG